MRHLLGPVLVLPLLAIGQPPPGYYDPAEGLTGNALRVALQDIIDGHTILSNSSLWSAFAVTDRKANNKVWDIYSDIPGGNPPYEFTFVTDQCGTYDSEGDCFNREHTFPQSWFNGAPPMDTDLFHLYPTDAWVNQRRANWPYGEVDAPTWTSDNGGKLGPCAYPGCTGTVFEPIDAYKGDLARSYFYLLTRYYGTATSWTTCPILQDGEFLPWCESLLLGWHEQDPVSDKEVARNNSIYTSLQGNRNPYIDNPEWVHRIWGPTAAIEAVEAPTFRIRALDNVIVITRETGLGVAEVQVFDARGSVVGSGSFTGPSGSVLLNMDRGLYIVELRDTQGRAVQRFIH